MRILQSFLALLLMAGVSWAQCADTSGSPDINIKPGTGTGCVFSSQAPIADQSTKGGPILSGAGGYEVKIGNFPYTIAAASSTGFGSGWSTLLINIASNIGSATITTPGTFEVTGGRTIAVAPGGWVAITADGNSYLTVGAGYTAVPITPDGTTSSAPNGTQLFTADGSWSWGGAAVGRAGEYSVNLNGASTTGIGFLMEVAHGGQFYVKTLHGDWFLWSSTSQSWASSPAP